MGGATLVGGAAVGTLAGCPSKSDSDGSDAGSAQAAPGGAEGEMTFKDVIPILVAMGDRLLPSDELGPGVKEAGLETYLQRTLADPRMKGAKSVVTRGAVFLGRAARQEHGKPFWELDAAARDALITRLANNEVRPNGFTPQAFVRIMLALSLEAFLGDPRHGGNKGEIGWAFIGGLNQAGRGR